MDTVLKIDNELFQFINGMLSNPLFDWLMPVITDINSWLLPLTILVGYLIFKERKKGYIVLLLLLVTVSFTDLMAAQIIKPLVERLRPSHALVETFNLLVPRGGKFGFVSNHAANSFAAAVILGYFYQRWKFLLYFTAFIVAFSRVYVGVHFPADVIFGGLFGYIAGWMVLSVWVIVKMHQLKRHRMWVWYETDDIY